MIRVLQMIGCLEMGGSQAMIMSLLRNINRSEIMFDFIIDHPEYKDYKEEVLALGAKIYEMPTFRGTNLFQIKKSWNAFFDGHPEYKILHSHVRSYASLYIPIAKRHGVKTIIHSHSTSNGDGVKALVKNALQYPLRFQADYLMACSNEAGEWLYGKRACQKPNYLFFPNAIDTERFRYDQKKATCYRKKWGLDGKFVVGHVGRFHIAKNHLFLLDAFANVCEKRSDAMLLLVGDGELRGEIENRIRELKIENRVILTGNRNDVSELMQMMDIFVFPSTWEGLPVSVIEAQANGLPCLISDRITKEVDVSELVKRLRINDFQAWTDAILHTDTERLDVTEKIKRAGFEVKDAAETLTRFYYSIGGYNGKIYHEAR